MREEKRCSCQDLAAKAAAGETGGNVEKRLQAASHLTWILIVLLFSCLAQL